MPDEICALERTGVGSVVSLLERAEVRELGLCSEPAVCEQHGISFVSFPIPDRGVPSSVHAFAALVASIRRDLIAGVAVAVHCRAGIGRSGLVAGGVLVALGQSPQNAFSLAGQARGVAVPDTHEQEAWLRTHAGTIRMDAPDSKAMGRRMKFSVEFEDSEVGLVAVDGDSLLVRFSAAAATGVEAQSRTAGHLRSVELLLQHATWHGDLGLCFGRLAGGRLVNGGAVLGPIPVPYQSNTPFALELQFRNGEVLAAEGQAFALRFNGPVSFFESHAC